MFDTYRNTPPLPGNINVKVTEQRAPTDESVRLLKEMEAAVTAKILNSFQIDNDLRFVAFNRQHNSVSMKVGTYLAFQLNGILHEIRMEESPEVAVDSAKNMHSFIAVIAQHITTTLLKHIMETEEIPSTGVEND